MAAPRDTTPDALRIQRDAFRRMTPARRLELAVELSDAVRAVSRAGAARRAAEPEPAPSDAIPDR